MAGIEMDLEGVGEAVAGLTVFEQAAQRRVDHALDASATETRDDAKENAPVDTANLRNSGGKEAAPAGTLGYIVFFTAEYARRIEFGFSGKDRLGREYDQAGQYFLTRAAKSNRARTLARVRRALQQR